MAKNLDKHINGKKNRENEIPLDEAAAFLVYMDLSEARWGYLKKFTDDRNCHLFPTYANVREERKKCVAEDLKVTDREAVASVKSTCDNYLGRLFLDPDVREKVKQVEEEYGDEIEEWQLENKGGWDGSTQKRYNVCIVIFFQEKHYFLSFSSLTLCFSIAILQFHSYIFFQLI